MAAKRRMTPQEVKRMGKLRAQGMNYSAIGREIGCSSPTVKRWLDPNYRECQRRNSRFYSEKWEKVLQRQSHYRVENKDKIRRYERARIANDIQYKLAHRLRARLNKAIGCNYKSGSAVRDLGCSIAYLKRYLESKFDPGMTWDNWTQYGWHVDHIKPLASFDLTDRAQLLEACHYTNLQPMWAGDNWNKGAKVLEEAIA